MDIQKLSRWQIAGLIVMAPIMGAAFVVFLPCVGFVIVGKAGLEKIREYASDGVRWLIATKHVK